MKLLLFLFLVTSNVTLTNIFFQKPEKLSKIDIQELVKSWQTEFNWHINFFKIDAELTLKYKHEKTGLLVKIFQKPILSHNYDVFSDEKISLVEKTPLNSYYFTEPLVVSNSCPQEIVVDELLQVLKNKKFIFYTGAGISAASGVMTMNQLENSLGFNNKWTILKNVLFYNCYLANQFSSFCQIAIDSNPTAAHHAISVIALTHSIAVLTENVDLLQEKTGILPIHLDVSFMQNFQNHELQEVEAIICVGLSHDDRGFLAYYKRHNPCGLIAAIDIRSPNYLSNKDLLIKDDLQVVLPMLASELCKKGEASD
jgi:hypothetical protein